MNDKLRQNIKIHQKILSEIRALRLEAGELEEMIQADMREAGLLERGVVVDGVKYGLSRFRKLTDPEGLRDFIGEKAWGDIALSYRVPQKAVRTWAQAHDHDADLLLASYWTWETGKLQWRSQKTWRKSEN